MKIKNILFVIAVCCGVFSSNAVGQTEPARTQYALFGTNFLSSWQTMRLTVQNPRFNDREVIPCIRVRVVLDFYEAAADGSVRPQAARRVVREVELDAGEAASFDIPATLICDGSVCPAARGGVYVGASVFAAPVGDGLPADYRPKFTPTLAVREFGRSILTLPVAEKGFDPQPDPPAPSN